MSGKTKNVSKLISKTITSFNNRIVYKIHREIDTSCVEEKFSNFIQFKIHIKNQNQFDSLDCSIRFNYYLFRFHLFDL